MILVTGGTGLIGSYLLKALVRNHQPVKALYRKEKSELLSPEERAAIEWIQGDILDVPLLEDVMQGVDQVYHVAGLVSFDPAHKKQLYNINVEGTANVVNAALNTGVKKLLHVSSVAALGRKRNGETVTEAQNWTPETSNSEYGKSKYLAELEVWRGISEGLSAVIINPVIVLGYGNWNTGSLSIFKNAYEEFPWYTEGASGFVDVRDVASAMVQLMNSTIENERFIISGENKQYKEIFTEAALQFEKKPPHKKVTPLLAQLVWRWEWLKSRLSGGSPLLTKETALTAQTTVYFDNTKLIQQLNNFSYTPLQETIRWSCELYRHQLKNA